MTMFNGARLKNMNPEIVHPPAKPFMTPIAELDRR
jgi:hypothetical protein